MNKRKLQRRTLDGSTRHKSQRKVCVIHDGFGHVSIAHPQHNDVTTQMSTTYNSLKIRKEK
jgi:hypothetical protein